MTKLQRYSEWHAPYGSYVGECFDGEYVLYNDVESDLRELAAYRQAVIEVYGSGGHDCITQRVAELMMAVDIGAST